jgi:beta-N-acetylhexosaminidase
MRPLVEQVGQLFMIGFDGPSPTPELRQLLREYAVGGIILFARNIFEPGQTAELVRELQSLARAAGQALPLLVAVDQEGGRVARFQEPWAIWPPMRALGRLDSEEHARRVGLALAEQLKPCGIRCDFAPVLDVDTNPANPVIGDRSLSDDPERVGRLGAAIIRGLQDGGVAACGKHFPGHGDTELDSHLALPAVDHSRSRLDDVELRPFRKAIEAEVALVMTAHIVVRELDATLPATLSPAAVNALLRKELGYQGVVVSDDLEMKAVADRWRSGLASVLAVKAGCDLMLVCHTPEAQAEAIEGVIHAVEGEEIARSAIDDASARLRRLKERFVLPYADPDPRAARDAARSMAHRVLAQEIANEGGPSA